jgi:hypothetical protein
MDFKRDTRCHLLLAPEPSGNPADSTTYLLPGCYEGALVERLEERCQDLLYRLNQARDLHEALRSMCEALNDPRQDYTLIIPDGIFNYKFRGGCRQSALKQAYQALAKVEGRDV